MATAHGGSYPDAAQMPRRPQALATVPEEGGGAPAGALTQQRRQRQQPSHPAKPSSPSTHKALPQQEQQPQQRQQQSLMSLPLSTLTNRSARALLTLTGECT